MRLPDLAIDRPVSTLMLLASLLLLGLVAVGRLPLGFMPKVERTRVHVEVDLTGGHPLEVLRELVEPLEDEIALVQGVLRIESEARVGGARVSAEFSPWDNMAVRRLEVRDAVDRARPSLPAGVGDVTVRSGWGSDDAEVVFQGRVSADRDLSMEWDLIEDRITRRLERVPGVAQVVFEGIEPPRVRVDLDLAALRRHGIGGADVAEAIQAANSGLALGVIRGPQLRFDVRDASRPSNADAIAGIPLPGSSLRVGDVANVTFRSPRLSYARTLNRKPAIGFDVFKDSSANTVAVVDGLHAEIDRVNEDPALGGLAVLVFLDQGEEIRQSLRGLMRSGVFGGLLAVVVLMLFLRRVMLTAVLAVAIPFSLVVTCGVLYMLGMELNVLTLLGLMLGVGMLVDNAIVVVENIHRLEQKGIPARDAARRGAGNVVLAVTAATATTVIVWTWLIFTEPSELKAYLGQVALTISLAVICSLVISLTFIPLVTARYLPARETRDGPIMRRVSSIYRMLLGFTLRHRLVTLALLLGLAASAWWPYSRTEMKDDISEVPLWVPISYQFTEPSTLERMGDVVDRVESAVWPHLDEMGVKNLYSFYSEERGWAVTRLYLERNRATEAYVSELRERLQPMLPEIPGVRVTTRERNFWRNFRSGTGERRVQLSFRGNEPETLGLTVAKVRDYLETVMPEAKEIITPEKGGQQEVRIAVEPDRVRHAGTTPNLIATTVAAAFRGRMLNRLQTPDGEREIFLSMPDSEEFGLAELANLPIPTEAGTTVPLDSIADIEQALTPDTIRREDQRISSWMMIVFPDDRTTEMAAGLIRERLDAYPFPNGVTWDFGTRGRQRDDTFGTMGRGVMLSLLIVLLLLAAMFESLTQPLAVIVTFPMAFFGSAWAVWAWKGELDITGFTGVIILIGIVVNNGIVLVDHVNLLRSRGRDRETAILEGCTDRLRPVLMTAITTIVGLLPLAFSTTSVSNALIDTLAIVVIGGLAASTIFTLLALPAWYTLLEDIGAGIARNVRLPLTALSSASPVSRRPPPQA